jgi:hypothetical protein
MKSHTPILSVIATLASLAAFTVSGHPGSGIVVDRQGNVFFSDVSRGLLKVNQQGKVTTISEKGGHWLALDASGRLSKVELGGKFTRHALAGAPSALVLGTDSPLVVGADDSLYYVCDDERMIPGSLQLARLTPDGRKTLVSPGLRRMAEEKGGIKGAASGPDGSFFLSFPKTVLRVARDGTLSTLLDTVVISDCNKLSASDRDTPSLRGLVADAHGAVFVAATGCRRVIKITADAKVATVLEAESPWSPCGVALHGEDLYVLEHRYTNPEVDEDWPPRVRKVGHDGRVSMLVTLPPVPK